jgi:hypothetical protein
MQVARLRIARGPTRLLVLGATAVVALGASAIVASATFVDPGSVARTGGSQREPMTDVSQIECDGSSPTGTPTQSSATITLTNDTVAADVSLVGLDPNEVYYVTLTQTSPRSDCGGNHAVATTDGQGNANVSVRAAPRNGRGAFIHAEGSRHILISSTFDFPE